MLSKALLVFFGLGSMLWPVVMVQGATHRAHRAVESPVGPHKNHEKDSSHTPFVINGRTGDNVDYQNRFFLHHRSAVTLQVLQDEEIYQDVIDSCQEYIYYTNAYHTDFESAYEHVCGATLISNNTVVTSADCIRHYVNKTIRAGVGWWELKEGEDGTTVNVHPAGSPGTNYQTYYVSDVTLHPNFEVKGDGTVMNNIAVVKLNQSVTLNTDVEIATLADPSPDNILKICKFNGWGLTKCLNHKVAGNPKTRANMIQGVQMNVTTQGLCEDMWDLKNMSISDTELCAFNWKKHSTVCDGDYGGGLMCNSTETPFQDSPNVPFLLTAIASRNDNDCLGCMPAVFENVTVHRTWLDQMIDAYKM